MKPVVKHLNNIFVAEFLRQFLVYMCSGAVDILGWTIHWGSTCCFVPSDSDQGHPVQV